MTKEKEKIKTHREYLELSATQAEQALGDLQKLVPHEEEYNLQLKDMKLKLEKLRDDSCKEIEDIQKNCKHEMHYAGHSHNDDCYECEICGFIDWR